MEGKRAMVISRACAAASGLLLVVLLGATGSPLSGGATVINSSSSSFPLLARSAASHPLTPLTARTSLSPGQPQSDPLDRVGGDSANGMSTHSALNLSSNWSGEVDSGPGATFTEVAGNWVVPTVRSSAIETVSSTWVGIDGAFASSQIRTGTAQNSGPGGTHYYAWYQIVPQAPVVNIGAAVFPGDTMHAAVSESAPGTWNIVLNDLTRAWSFSQAFAYNTPGTSAEWIEEAPTNGGGVTTLADYGSITFTDLGIGGTGLSSAFTNPVYMSDQSGAIISYPADLNTSTDSFSVFYGSPRPQVTSVSPNSGGPSGGTTVTIGGNFVTGVSSVAFGGISVAFTADVANGTVTASSPAHSSGVVDVTVTTPGGTSQQTSADQFTYGHGYWLVGSDGGIFAFGTARFHGSMGATPLQRPVVGIVATRDQGGYWLDASDGGVFSFGDTQFYGSIPGLGLHPAGSGLPNSLNAPIVGMVPSDDQGGYFMAASDGGVFAFGDAHFAGSCPGIGGCVGAAVAVMPDGSGNGYWLITQIGNVYTFGDAPYLGAPGPQSSPITSAVATPSGHGYWILDGDGQVFAYGDAAYLGNVTTDATGGVNPATAIFATSDSGGYWVTDSQGKVFTFGDAPNVGDMSGTRLNGSIIAASGS
jgi:Peptidase A4 family/IPT/TIG domain